MDFDRLRAFVWTLEEGGISAAARRLCRTQPAVTRMLQTLEEQVGAELIDRKARPMRPTVAGLRVLDYARDILQAADRLSDGSVRPDTARQILRMGVSRSLLWQLRDPRFAHASSPLSETDFIVRSGWSPRLYRRFVRSEFDGAILLMPIGWTPDVPCSADLLRSEPLVIVAPRGLNAGPKGQRHPRPIARAQMGAEPGRVRLSSRTDKTFRRDRSSAPRAIRDGRCPSGAHHDGRRGPGVQHRACVGAYTGLRAQGQDSATLGRGFRPRARCLALVERALQAPRPARTKRWRRFLLTRATSWLWDRQSPRVVRMSGQK